jgi:opacity protein-like surface antigen
MMKKMLLASALLCAALGAVSAQEGAGASGGTRFSTGYVLSNFPETSVEDGWLRGARGIVQEAKLSNDERRMWGGLGNSRDIDTSAELLAMASVLGIQDVKKEDALKLYAEIAMEGAANSFLNVTGTTHSQVLERLNTKYNFTQAEINGTIRDTVAAVVDAEFGKVSFLLKNSSTSHNAVLTRDIKTNQYVLTYTGYYTNGETKTLSAPTLDALKAEMRKNRADFDETGIRSVEANAALMPAAIFDGWKKTTPNMVNPYELLTKALTGFYTTPNEANYKIVRGILARTSMTDLVDGDDFTDYLWHSVCAVLASLNQGLYDKMSKELWQNEALFAAAEIPNDPRYGIFTLTKASGDEIFVSKRRQAPGLVQ